MIEGHVYYLAGPMTGQPGFNYPLFDKTANLLREKGHIIINPTDLDAPDEYERFRASADGNMRTLPKGMPTYEELIARNVPVIMKADGMCLLKGYPESKGTMLELMVAWHVGIRSFWYVGDPQMPVCISNSHIYRRIVTHVTTI